MTIKNALDGVVDPRDFVLEVTEAKLFRSSRGLLEDLAVKLNISRDQFEGLKNKKAVVTLIRERAALDPEAALAEDV